MKSVTCLLFIYCCLLPFTANAESISAVNSTTHSTQAVQPEQIKGYVAIIIDDLGYKRVEDQRTLALPGAVTLSFLPLSPHVKQLAEQGFLQGNEIMLHLPMQSVEAMHLGPGALTVDMSEAAFKASVKESLNSVPHVKGINNHMGSLLTSYPAHMTWLMELIKPTDLFFIDSRTTTETVAETIANEFQIPNARRNVFLDHELNQSTIEYQFRRLINLAKRDGYAIGIGHPFSETLDFLEQKLSELAAANIKLIPVSELIHAQQTRKKFTQTQHRRTSAWQTSSSQSHQDAKN